ncbi:MAG: hypothetical protein JKY37_25985 [Nannocystaceae bacterium]|nr:hypothetical protein [Nannocystaceae bacterium]
MDVSHRKTTTGGSALVQGLSAVSGRLGDIAVIWLASLLLALPLALSLQASISQSLGHSEAGTRMLTGWDGLWFRSWEAQATGLQQSFKPAVVGIGAVFEGLDAMVTGALGSLPAAVLAAAGAYVLLWVLLSGGLIARYASPSQPPHLLRAGAEHFLRLLPLAGLAIAAYAFIFAVVLPMLTGIEQAALLDVNDERVAVAYAATKYGVVWLAVWSVGLVHDYAKVMRVTDRSLGALSAIADAVALMWRRAGTVMVVALGVFGGFIVVVLVYWFIAPGVQQGNPFKILMAFAVGQVSVAARIGLRCWGHAARVAVLAEDGGDVR